MHGLDLIQEVAKIMCDCDVGSLPVGENDQLVGMITDRDIAVRAVAENKPTDESARRHERRSALLLRRRGRSHVARNMADQQVRRLPVVNRDKRLVGSLALADLATRGDGGHAGEALQGISQTGGQHNQASG